jgi:hypothetical protein
MNRLQTLEDRDSKYVSLPELREQIETLAKDMQQSLNKSNESLRQEIDKT